MPCLSKKRIEALFSVVRYACIDDRKEFDDYLNQCDENGTDPHDFQNPTNQGHVYVKALIGLGLESGFNCMVKGCRECTPDKEKDDEYFIRVARNHYGLEVRDNARESLISIGRMIDAGEIEE